LFKDKSYGLLESFPQKPGQKWASSSPCYEELSGAPNSSTSPSLHAAPFLSRDDSGSRRAQTANLRVYYSLLCTDYSSQPVIDASTCNYKFRGESTANRMSGWRFALSLSDAQVKAAEPPGTSKLIGMFRELISQLECLLMHRDHSPSSWRRGSARRRIAFDPQTNQRAEDPLNWPMWRKCGALFALCFYVLVAEYASAVPASVLPTMAYSTQPPTPFAKLTPIMAVCIRVHDGLTNVLCSLSV
jgi:hypothetical protein